MAWLRFLFFFWVLRASLGLLPTLGPALGLLNSVLLELCSILLFISTLLTWTYRLAVYILTWVTRTYALSFDVFLLERLLIVLFLFT